MLSFRRYFLELNSDPTIRTHLAQLYDTLLEQNLLRIVEAYSVVDIDYIAQQVKQSRSSVEAKCVHLFPFFFALPPPSLSSASPSILSFTRRTSNVSFTSFFTFNVFQAVEDDP